MNISSTSALLGVKNRIALTVRVGWLSVRFVNVQKVSYQLNARGDRSMKKPGRKFTRDKWTI